MDPIAQALSDLQPAPPNPYANGGGQFVQQPDPPMFGNTPPAPPTYGQPVYAQPPQQPQYATPPTQPSQNPQQPVYAQPPQQPQVRPGQPLPEYSLTPPPTQTPQQDQMPAWAAGLYEQVQGLQEKITTPQNQPPAGNDWPWPDIPKTWQGLQTAIDRVATEKATAKVTEYQQLQAETVQQQQQAQAQADQLIDSTLNQLRQTGILPIITDPTNPNDVGKQYEKELIGYTLASGGKDHQDLVRMAPTLRALHDSGVYFDASQRKLVRRGSQSAAASAPIAGGTPVMSGDGSTPAAPSQKQFATMNLQELTQLGMSQLQ